MLNILKDLKKAVKGNQLDQSTPKGKLSDSEFQIINRFFEIIACR